MKLNVMSMIAFRWSRNRIESHRSYKSALVMKVSVSFATTPAGTENWYRLQAQGKARRNFSFEYLLLSKVELTRNSVL